MNAKTYLVLLFVQIFTILTINCATPSETQTVKVEKTSYNILAFFHMPCYSHHILGSTLLKELARRGFNVTMVSPFPFKEKIPNYTDIELKDMMSFKEEYMQPFIKGYYTYSNIVNDLLNMIPKLGDSIYSQESVQDLIRSDSKFDLIIIFNPMSEMLLPFSYRFNAPIILFSPIGSTFFINSITGNISPYSYVPHVFSPYSDNMNFIERVQNTLIGITTEIISYILIRPQFERIIEKYFPNSPSLNELRDNVALALVNSHFSTETPRPYTPNMIQIGGFHVENIDPLPKELQKYLDDSKDGVVYFNFGTNINIADLQTDKLKIILKCLWKLKQNVLWKYDGNLQGIPKNVRSEKWLPQKSVLAHPNVKAFITHGGKGSVIEATKASVPMLAIPFFGDQSQNVAEAVSGKYAIKLTFNDITEDSFTKALYDVIYNPIYKENIEIKSSLLNVQPIKPMDLATYWIEHVIKYKGADHLKPAILKLNIFQQISLDVITFIIGTLFATIFVIYLSIKRLCKLCKCRKQRTKASPKSKVKKS